MAYPPVPPPNDRLNTTPMVDNHPSDHNVLSDAITDINNELGNNPQGTFANVEERLDDIEEQLLPKNIVVSAWTSVTGIGATEVELTAVTRTVAVVPNQEYKIEMWLPYRFGLADTAFLDTRLEIGSGIGTVALGREYKTRIDNERAMSTVVGTWIAPVNVTSYEFKMFCSTSSGSFQTDTSSLGRTYGYQLAPAQVS